MVKFYSCCILLFFTLYCFGQTPDFVIVSSSSTTNANTFTVGEIFLVGQNTTTGFLASHLTTDVKVAVNEIESNDLSHKINVFPNPAKDIIHFDINSDLLVNKRIKIFSVLGELVLDELLKGNTISISSLNDGQYIIQLGEFEKTTIVVVK